jgi:ribosomal protein L13
MDRAASKIAMHLEKYQNLSFRSQEAQGQKQIVVAFPDVQLQGGQDLRREAYTGVRRSNESHRPTPKSFSLP